MSVQHHSIIRYSLSFKKMVVKQIEEGLEIEAARRRYGIGGGSTIQRWIRKFGKHQLLNKVVHIQTMEEKDRVKELEAEIKKLKMALADSLLAQRCLETVIDEANKEYKTDLKKNFGDSASSGGGKSSA